MLAWIMILAKFYYFSQTTIWDVRAEIWLGITMGIQPEVVTADVYAYSWLQVSTT